MDLIRYFEEAERYKEVHGCYPPTWEERRRENREALRLEAEDLAENLQPSNHPPIPRRRRKYWT